MQDEYSIIGKIMAKYPVITDEEQQVLNEWIDRNGRERFDSIVDNETRIADLTRFLQLKQRKEENRERYYGAVVAFMPKAKQVWWNKWQTYVAAASVVIIASIFVYVLTTGRKSVINETAPIVQVRDADPGKFKAKLRLSDNSEIILDSALNKQLAEQGGVTVMNKDGKLVYLGKQNSGEVLYNTLYTSKGEMYATVLADGSKVWLNSQSSVRYPVTLAGDERRVEISGEAYFEVAPSQAGGKKRPFIVDVNGMTVEVLGTHFNINAYSDENAIKTTLLEGKVKVVKAGSLKVLTPGQQAQVSSGSAIVDVVKEADIEQAVAWKNGYFQFSKDNLQTVLRQLARWYDLEIVYEGPVSSELYSGKISRSAKISELFGVLETNDIHFRVEGKKLIVTK